MKVGQFVSPAPIQLQDPLSARSSSKGMQETFGNTLQQAIKDVNALQDDAGKAVDRFVSGETPDLHEVMIAAEKAKTSFELLMEVRNKTIDVYRELMRMQV